MLVDDDLLLLLGECLNLGAIRELERVELHLSSLARDTRLQYPKRFTYVAVYIEYLVVLDLLCVDSLCKHATAAQEEHEK